MPDELLHELDAAATAAGVKRSQALQSAVRNWLEQRHADSVREQISRYYRKHQDETLPDEESTSWQEYQRNRMSQEYGDDEW